MTEQPTTDPSAPAFINRLPIEDLRQLASLDTVHKRFIAEIDRLTAENRLLTRGLNDTMDDRERAQTMADRLAYAIAPIEIIGEHSSGNCPWDNAHDITQEQNWPGRQADGEGGETAPAAVCTCARSWGLHSMDCALYVPGHDLASTSES